MTVRPDSECARLGVRLGGMGSCCDADDYQRVFTEAEARRHLHRFLQKGLSGSEGQLADAVAAIGINRSTILEVGGGMGALHASLLQRGARQATSIDLSSNWDAAATELLSGLGLAGRVTRMSGDAVEIASELVVHDVAIAHRVVCCYPDWEPLLRMIISRSRQGIGLTFPRDTWLVRSGLAMGNLCPRLSGMSFRAHVHDPTAMIDLVEDAGFEVTYDESGLIWRTMVFAR